jgi:TonB-linked SusC/RagA family outer membrane protein
MKKFRDYYGRFLLDFLSKKTIRVMKLIFILSILTISQLWATETYSQLTKLNLKLDDVKISDALKAIENQSEFFFLYSPKLIDVERKVNIDVKNEPIKDILRNIFDEKVKYIIYDKQIILIPSDVTSISSPMQQQSITGTVNDAKTGEPLSGVTVVIVGTTKGTTTDKNGKYLIETPSMEATLAFSFVGYNTVKVPISGKSVINVSLEQSVQALSEVVVTALGISKDKRQINYAIQNVKGEQLVSTGNINLSKSLEGKIAGVTIRQVSGSPGDGAQILIRGSSSISGNNAPMYVVDGAPVDDIISIDPSEIESLNVLKGATAAALYGLRASNGVIVVTTKKGGTNQMNKPTITLTSSFTLDNIAVKPQLQKLYGQGVGGVFSAFSPLSYGPLISTWGTYTNQLGEQEQAKAYDNWANCTQTGNTNENSITLSNKFVGGNYHFGVSNIGQVGMIPHTSYRQTGFTLGADYEIFKKLTLSTFENYGFNRSEPLASTTVMWGLAWCPISYDLAHKPTHVEGDPYTQINFRGGHDNPIWSINNNYVDNRTSSLITTNELIYKPLDWLSLNLRVGYNASSTVGKTVYAFGSQLGGGRTIPPSGGQIFESSSATYNLNSDFLATINHRITDRINVELIVGHEFHNYRYSVLSSTGSGFAIPDLDNLSNCSTVTTGQALYQSRSYALFGNLNLNYGKILNLTVTARNDVVSNMPRAHRSFFYPSIGLGFAFTEAMNQKPSFLDFGRVRVSYAEVGQAGSIYSTQTVYVKGDVANFTFPFNGINAYTLSGTLNSTDLKPENRTEWEAGINLIFFSNRINLDYTYFSSISQGQIFSVPVSTATGFTSEMRNAGEMTNKGHEIELGIKPIIKEQFSWDLSTNFSTYKNVVTKLAEGVSELAIGQNVDATRCVARPGEDYPILRGYGFLRDPNTGKVVVESNNTKSTYGMPLRTAAANVVFGKVNPDFEINFGNTFKYKNISLSFQVDWRQGGILCSGESRLARVYGVYKESENRDKPFIYPDAVKGTLVNGTLVVQGDNDIVLASRNQPYYSNMDGIWEYQHFDASFIRVREANISYDFSPAILQKVHIKLARFSLVGRNLWLIKSGLPYFDPEMSPGTGNAQGFTNSTATYPQVRNLGFRLELEF